MIDIETFIIAQQANWIRLAHFSSRDNWRYDLRCIGNNNVLNITSSEIDKLRHPVLFNLISSFEKVTLAHFKINDNFYNSFLLNNPVIRRNREDFCKLTSQFLHRFHQ